NIGLYISRRYVISNQASGFEMMMSHSLRTRTVCSAFGELGRSTLLSFVLVAEVGREHRWPSFSFWCPQRMNRPARYSAALAQSLGPALINDSQCCLGASRGEPISQRYCRT